MFKCTTIGNDKDTTLEYDNLDGMLKDVTEMLNSDDCWVFVDGSLVENTEQLDNLTITEKTNITITNTLLGG